MDMKPLSQRKWRNILIEPFVQIKIGSYVLLLSLIYSGTLAIYLWDAYDEQFYKFESAYRGDNARSIFEQSLHSSYVFLLGALILVFMLSLLLVVIRRTHRMFGPMVPVERFVDAIADGDYSQRIKIRNKDHFQDLAAALNCVAESLQKRESSHETKGTQG